MYSLRRLAAKYAQIKAATTEAPPPNPASTEAQVRLLEAQVQILSAQYPVDNLHQLTTTQMHNLSTQSRLRLLELNTARILEALAEYQTTIDTSSTRRSSLANLTGPSSPSSSGNDSFVKQWVLTGHYSTPTLGPAEIETRARQEETAPAGPVVLASSRHNLTVMVRLQLLARDVHRIKQMLLDAGVMCKDGGKLSYASGGKHASGEHHAGGEKQAEAEHDAGGGKKVAGNDQASLKYPGTTEGSVSSGPSSKTWIQDPANDTESKTQAHETELEKLERIVDDPDATAEEMDDVINYFADKYPGKMGSNKRFKE